MYVWVVVVTSEVTVGVAGVAGAAATEEIAAKAMPAATARDLNENIILKECGGASKKTEKRAERRNVDER